MIKQEAIPNAHMRLFNMAVKVANHLGHIPSDQPNYDPLRDADVLDFMDKALFNEIQAESQEFAHLDKLDMEL